MTLLHTVRRAVRHLGLDITRYPASSPAHQRLLLMRALDVDFVFDIGANVGQFALELRRLGYADRMHSVEPLEQARSELVRRSRRDPLWTVSASAVAAETGSAVLHVAGNSVSSSLRGMLPLHAEAAPSSAYASSVEVQVETLDALAERELAGADARVFLKVDVQGAEMDVLVGGEATLRQVVGLVVEASLAPVYEGALAVSDLLKWATTNGFAPVRIDPGFTDQRNGRVLQCDVTLARETCLRRL